MPQENPWLTPGSDFSPSVSSSNSHQGGGCQEKSWSLLVSDPDLPSKPLSTHRLQRDAPPEAHTFKARIGNVSPNFIDKQRKSNKVKRWGICSKLKNEICCCCCCSVAQSCSTLCGPMDCSMPAFPILHYLQESAQSHVLWASGAIQLSYPLSSPSPLAFNLSQHQGLFQWVIYSHQWPKYWSFNFSISPSNEYSGLISFRTDLFDLLAVQGTLKSLLQHHNSKASILQCSAFFIAQLSNLYMTTGKTIALSAK